MKPTLLRLLSLFIVVIPMTATSQNNIRRAFDAIIECSDAQISESHTLDTDPATKSKIGQSDVYNFVLPDEKIDLVRNVISAFNKDRVNAYGFNQGDADSSEMGISLAVGDDDSYSGVRITDKGGEYVYALFLAPTNEDPDGIYRYAYGMNFKEKNGKITGKLVITYATTLQHRQLKRLEKQYNVLSNFSNGAIVLSTTGSSSQSWFDTLMTYFGSMTSANPQTRIALATKAYKVICDTSKYTDVTNADRNSVREILKGMISDPEYSETVLNNLLNQCLVNLKR